MGMCADSGKPGKVLANRALRARTRQVLANCRDFDNLVLPTLREVSNVWDFPKDGKFFIRPQFEDYRKYMRK